jgi:hypothetical protein
LIIEGGNTDSWSLSIVKQPLETALDSLLRPLALGYRAIDSHTLQVATQQELDRRLQRGMIYIGFSIGFMILLKTGIIIA